MAELARPTVRALCHFDGHPDANVKLNQRQLTGWACFYCGRQSTTMVKVGHADTDPTHGLFACAAGGCRWKTWLEGLPR